jgi:flavin reductase (DIM6/NTAB) family NADH-FMN oxidoreductase RutF
MPEIRPEQHSPKDIYKMMIGLIVPRPIAFVSSMDEAGALNLAPFSFFNGVCSNPPVVSVSIGTREHKSLGPVKDTLRNVQATGEFVVNVVSEEIVEQMNACAAELPASVDEFKLSGLTPLASSIVAPPRVAEAKAAMECKLLQIIPVGEEVGGAHLILGRIVCFHLRDELFERFHVDPAGLRAVGRMAGAGYVRTTDRFDLKRPKDAEQATKILHHEKT